MNDESLAQIGESYIQAQQQQEKQKKSSVTEAEEQITEEKDEFNIKILGDLICKVMDIVFSRINWEKLNIEEKQAISNSFVGVIRKRVPRVVKWGAEIDFGITMAIIILSRINILREHKEEKSKNENKGISNNFNFRTQGRGKNLFPRRVIKKLK